MSVRVKQHGRWIPDAIAHLEGFPDRLKREMDDAMGEFTEALREAVPKRTGTLRATGSWDSEMDADAGLYAAEASFGGEAAPYGVYVIGEYVKQHLAVDDVLPLFEERFEQAIHKAMEESD